MSFISFQNLSRLDDFTLGRSVVEFDTNDLPPAERRAFIAANLHFPGALDADSPLVQTLGARLTNFTRRLDPSIRIPESYQFNAGVERELGRGFAVEANYTFNRGIHLWREFNANAPRLPAGFRDFAEYLLLRDFANFRNAAGVRPVYDTSTAGDLVRFTLSPPSSTDTISRVMEFGVPLSSPPTFRCGAKENRTRHYNSFGIEIRRLPLRLIVGEREAGRGGRHPLSHYEFQSTSICPYNI